jgi:dihydrofolate reductase
MVGELIVNMFVTLDAVVQAPGEPSEDVEGGFEHGGWQASYLDEESGGVMFADMAHLDALLLGCKTYEIFAAYWPQGPEEIPFTALLNNAPKYVASRTLECVEWNNSNLIQGEIANEVPRPWSCWNRRPSARARFCCRYRRAGKPTYGNLAWDAH